MTAQELKNSILQLAMQGKLVPHTNENASELLEKIKKSHADSGPLRGSLKNKKGMSVGLPNPCDNKNSIAEDEKPFDIPENWCWCRLGEILIKLTDGTHSTPKYTSNGIPFLSVKDMSSGILDFSNCKYISEKEHKELFSRCNPELGDLLLTKVGTTGIPVLVDTKKEFSLFVSVALLKFNQEFIFNKFLKYIIEAPLVQNQAKENTKGVGNKNWVMKDIANTIIPLPPLAEQKAIVAKIEELLPYIEKYDAAYTKLEEFNKKFPEDMQKSILQQAVQGKLVPQDKADGNAKDLLAQIKAEKEKLIAEGKIKRSHTDSGPLRGSQKNKFKGMSVGLPNPCDNKNTITEDEIPFEIPEHWCWCRLGEIVNLFTGNSINETEKIKNYTNLKDGYNYIATKDVSFEKEIDYNNGIKIPFEKENFRIAHKESPLMCIEGGSAGRKIGFLEEDVCFGNKLCVFESYIKGYSKYVYYYLQSPMFTDIFKSNLNGIIGGVSVNKLKTLLIPLPPLAEQKAIVAKIEELLPLCKKLEKH